MSRACLIGRIEHRLPKHDLEGVYTVRINENMPPRPGLRSCSISTGRTATNTGAGSMLVFVTCREKPFK